MNDAAAFPDGFRRVSQALAERGHPHAPRWLAVAARTSQEAADALGVQVGQIAKSVVFRRRADDTAVLVVTSGDRRVDEKRVAAITGPLGRADAEFVKQRTGFSIGGVAPLAHASPALTLIDRELFRFDEIWAAAGHPNGVFRLSPAQLERLTGAPVADVVQLPPDQSGSGPSAGPPHAGPHPPGGSADVPVGRGVVISPCNNVCKMDPETGWCLGCQRTIQEIATWARMDDDAKRAVWHLLPGRRGQGAAA